jgi:peptide/nickel transport system permease protein
MGRYIIRRLLQAIPLLFIISIIIFLLLQNSGDPLAILGAGARSARGANVSLDSSV